MVRSTFSRQPCWAPVVVEKEGVLERLRLDDWMMRGTSVEEPNFWVVGKPEVWDQIV